MCAAHAATAELDQRVRCKWSLAHPEFPLYMQYHDEEWGRPEADDQRLFEKLCLESFQSGLSWRTILAKRETFRAAFDAFDFHKIALYTEDDVERLLQDAGIVRHRGKINATINNAQRALEVISAEGSLAHYFWRFEPSAEECAALEYPAATAPSSIALAKDLKKRGWKFVGPTTVYAFMQSVGMVNDHAAECEWFDVVEAERARFVRP